MTCAILSIVAAANTTLPASSNTGIKSRFTFAEADEFWTIVRGRMAELRLDQGTLAERLAIERSNVSRRLSGKVRDAPDAHMLAGLLEILDLPSAQAQRLKDLARGAGEPSRTPTLETVAAYQTAPIAGATQPVGRWWATRAVWTLALVLIAVVLILGAIWMMTHVTMPGPSATFSAPADGAIVPLGWSEIEGTQDRISAAGPDRLWVVEHEAGFYWPQQQVVLQGRQWKASARFGGGPEDIGKQIDLLLVLAPAEADEAFQNYLTAGGASGNYLPLRGLPQGTSILDHRRVTIASP